jgi:predicted NAD-dependent protein-ADP-ribosyltransferase YbiA (DUF1768 family)
MILFYGHTEGKYACFSNFYPIQFDLTTTPGLVPNKHLCIINQMILNIEN